MWARAADGHFATSLSDDHSLIDLLACMLHVLRWSLIHRKYNCGSYAPVQWIESIAGCYKAAEELNRDPWETVPLTGERIVWPIFRLVPALLKSCVDRQLLTHLDDDDREGNTDWRYFYVNM